MTPAATQWVMRGTNIGPLPDDTPATGRTITLQGASFAEIDGDKVRAERIYFDRLICLNNWAAQMKVNNPIGNR